MAARLWFFAVLLAVSGAARAQADYSLYGVLDLSYGRFEPSGTLADHRFNSNSRTASFVGVNAKYGFEGGWTPGVTLETFLPWQLSEDEARTAISAIIAELGATSMKDMGRTMAEVKQRHATSIEPAKASALVKALLAGQ